MAGPSSIPSALSHAPSHDQDAANLRILFAQGFDVQTADHDLLNKLVIHRFNQYKAVNAEDYSLWDCIQIDFEKWEAKHFNELDNATWRVVRDYCYPHGYWIDHNIGPCKTCTTAMLKVVEADWNGKWTIEQIQWVERQYKTLSRITRKRKQELTGISDVDSASNLEHPTEDSLGLWAEPQISPIPAPLTQGPPAKQASSVQVPLAPAAPASLTRASPTQPSPTPATPVQATMTEAPPAEQASLVQVPLAQAPPIQVPPTPASPIKTSSAPAPLIQSSPTSALLVPLAPVDRGHEQSEKHLDQLTIASPSDICSVVDKFAIYHPHYKEKLGITESTNELVTNSAASLFVRDSGACAAQPGLLAKKGEPPRTFVYLSHPFQPQSLMLSSTLSKMRAAMLEYFLMSKWQLSSALANFPLLADYPSVKLTSKETIQAAEDRKYLTSTQKLPVASFDLSRAAQTIKFSPDNNTVQLISYVICLADTTNKANIIHWSSMKCKRVTRDVHAADLYAMAHRLGIEKRHWGRYQIGRKKSYQHQHYGMGGTGEYKQASMKQGRMEQASMKKGKTERASTGI